MEQKIADLIVEHAAIGYSYRDGQLDINTLHIAPHGAAHMIAHLLTHRTVAERATEPVAGFTVEPSIPEEGFNYWWIRDATGRDVGYIEGPQSNERQARCAKAIAACLASPAAPSPAMLSQHVGWIKLYAEGMTIDNWRDQKTRILRQAGELSTALTAQPATAWLHRERDDFIVSKGLWSEFTEWLKEREVADLAKDGGK